MNDNNEIYSQIYRPTKEEALIKAAMHGDVESLEYLLLCGANPNAKDNFGDTALTWAKLHGNKKAEKILRAYGAKEETSIIFSLN